MILRTLSALVAIGGGLLLGACGEPAIDGCAPGEPCLVVSAPRLGDGLFDTLEVVARTDHQLLRTAVTDQVLRPPLALPLGLPQRLPGERLTLHLRATASATTPLPFGARLDLPADGTTRYSAELRPPCDAASCPTPAARRGAALGYDPATAQVVMFGGQGADGTPLADTWTFDGAAWQVRPGAAPPARQGAVLVAEPGRGQLVLFGGLGAAGAPLGDTWLLGTDGWQPLTGGTSPGARSAAAAAAVDGGVLLFGGLGAAGAVLGDTWLLGAGGWQQLSAGSCQATPAQSPRCRHLATLTSDGKGGAILLGGRLGPAAAGTPLFDDTVWAFSGGGWSTAPYTLRPELVERFGHVAALVGPPAAPAAMLLGLGESAAGVLPDSFLLNAATGQAAPQLGDAPAARHEAALVYDGERGQALLFGGVAGDGSLLADTWRHEPVRGFAPR